MTPKRFAKEIRVGKGEEINRTTKQYETPKKCRRKGRLPRKTSRERKRPPDKQSYKIYHSKYLLKSDDRTTKRPKQITRYKS